MPPPPDALVVKAAASVEDHVQRPSIVVSSPVGIEGQSEFSHGQPSNECAEPSRQSHWMYLGVPQHWLVWTSLPRPRHVAEHCDLHARGEPSSHGAGPSALVGMIVVGLSVAGGCVGAAVVGSLVAGEPVGAKDSPASVGAVDTGTSVGAGVGFEVGSWLGLGVGAGKGEPEVGAGGGAFVVGVVTMASSPVLMAEISG